MLKELFQSIWQEARASVAERYKAEVVDLGGLPYLKHGEKLQHAESSVFPDVDVHTLAGLCDYAKLKDWPEGKKLFAVVVNPTTVQLAGPVEGKWLERDVAATARAFERSCYRFGSYLKADEFVVELQAKFADSPDRAALLATIGVMTSGAIRTASDDGISQSVTVKAGVSLVGEKPVKNPVVLKPYRTFNEVDQPSSLFVFRVRETGGTPECALFEADGGAWQEQAVLNVTAYLVANLPEGIKVLR